MKIAYWDIETNDLNGEFGRVLVASVLSLPSGQMTTLRIDKYIEDGRSDDMLDDKALLTDLRSILEDHHITSGWYSKGFDIPFVNTRLAAHGLKPVRSHLHLDGIWYAKGWRGIKAQSGKLKDVARFFQLEEVKLEMSPDDWQRARLGQSKAMNKAVLRCESDVRLTREVTERLLGLGLVANIQRYP